MKTIDYNTGQHVYRTQEAWKRFTFEQVEDAELKRLDFITKRIEKHQVKQKEIIPAKKLKIKYFMD